ncbi:MAG: YciI family protein [Nocardioidaceae bacterium]
MNYLLLMWATDEISGGTEADYQAWMTYEQELKDAGVFVAGAALQSHASAARYIRPVTSKLLGEPIAPSRDQELQIGGYYLISCASDDDALEWARKMPTYGLVEVRPELTFEGNW